MWFKLKPSKVFLSLVLLVYLAALFSIWLADIHNVIQICLSLGTLISFTQNVRQYILQPQFFSILTKNRLILIDRHGVEEVARLKFKILTKLFIVLGLKLAKKSIFLIVFNGSLGDNIYRLLASKINHLRADIGK